MTYQKELLEFPPLDVFLPKRPSMVGTKITPKPSRMDKPIYHLSRSIASAIPWTASRGLAPSFGIDIKVDSETQVDCDTGTKIIDPVHQFLQAHLNIRSHSSEKRKHSNGACDFTGSIHRPLFMSRLLVIRRTA